MPRNPGTGQYSKPIPAAVPNTTIASAPYNLNVDDVVIDLNAPRPVVAGGTGASNAYDAMINLNGEIAVQVVDNYDSYPFAAGSFKSAAGATSAPVAGHAFAGICYVYTYTDHMVVEARDLDDGHVPGYMYVRRKAGTWGSWVRDVNDKVDRAGDTMTGDLIISKTGPVLRLNRPAAGSAAIVQSTIGAVNRWQMELGNAAAESGGNVGSEFVLNMYDDGGAFMGAAIRIARNQGQLTLALDPTLALHAVTKQYADTKVAKAGDTMSGHLTLPTGPAAANAVRKDYVDTATALKVTKAGDTMTGTLGIQLSPLVIATGAMNIGYVAPYGIMLRPNTDTGPVPIVFTNSASTICGQISTTTTTTTYATSSDDRLKTDLQEFDAGRIVDETRVYSFAWKSGGRAYGVSAQQAQEVYPQAVVHDKQADWYGVDYSKYVPILLQELQALRARVTQLEAGTVSKPA